MISELFQIKPAIKGKITFKKKKNCSNTSHYYSFSVFLII